MVSLQTLSFITEDERGERKCIGPNPLKELRIGAVSEQGSWHKFSHVNLVCKMAQEGLAPKRMDGRKNRNFCELRGNAVFCIPCPYGMFVASSLLSLSLTGVGDRKKLRHFLFHAVFRCRSCNDILLRSRSRSRWGFLFLFSGICNIWIRLQPLAMQMGTAANLEESRAVKRYVYEEILRIRVHVLPSHVA